MDLEFYEPAEAAALMRCTEAWLREGAASGRFPHACWGKGKIIFTSEHIAEIARLREVPVHTGSTQQERLIGTRARRRLSPLGYQQPRSQQA
ncbi:hypothetical protein AU252_01885 [Pseudarthrobacter sulfonivorans]|uniref:DNA-binding protein n=1 Tax=Pseudarthrobacter sulfonivorans TaxID=121292 RepID=A0A0U3QKB8_9MICC|nr:hypothetical protein [Pseudarthrobacter sulfonivorans]ALV40069.1 hypothetical protein AU252_01885 [Pseudarthrobacter sulfonivorans]